MEALPNELKEENGLETTGVTCVECPGVLQVQSQGRKRHLRFKCRVGHAFSTHELVAGKEKRLEDHFWALVLGMEELNQLLRDLERYEDRKAIRASYERRIARLEAHVKTVRALLSENDPVDFTADAPDAKRADEPDVGDP